MARLRAWILNLDADDELALPEASSSRAMRARVATIAARIPLLLADGDLLLAEDAPSGCAAGRLGRAWCPTRRALARLRDASAIVGHTPSFDVIRRVNHRAFAADLGITLPGARFVPDVDDVLATIQKPSPSGSWLLKRAYGFAGRGHMRVGVEALTAQELRWIRASVGRDGGLQVEPLVMRRGDFALHGYIDRQGAILLGEPTRQTCDERGIYRGSERVTSGDLFDDERAELEAAATNAARAMFNVGYVGPFGIDAFRYLGEGGALQFNPRCEINARYTMGWAIGMGDRRPDLETEMDPPSEREKPCEMR